jgi:hypothetical protein
MDHGYIEENMIADRYLMHDLSSEECEQFELHFMDCDQCFHLVEEIQEVRELLDTIDLAKIKRANVSAPRYSLTSLARLRPRWAAIVPAIAILIFITALLFLVIDNRRLRNEVKQSRAMQVSPPPQPAPKQEGNPQHASPHGPAPPQTSGSPPATHTKPGDLASMQQSQTNLPIYTLRSERRGEQDSNEEVVNEVVIPRSAGWFVISLPLETKEKYESYRASIVASKKLKWHARGLQPNNYNTFVLGFSSTLFQPGDYLLNLEGVNREQSESVANYPFRIIKK